MRCFPAALTLFWISATTPVLGEAGGGCLATDGVAYYQASLAKPSYACEKLGTVQRFEVHAGDRGWGGDAGNGNERSEVVTKDGRNPRSPLYYPPGVDAWVSYAFRVVSSLPLLKTAYVGQFHSISDPLDKGQGAMENFVLSSNDNGQYKLTLFTRSDANPISTTGARGVPRWSMTLKQGQWVRIVLRTRFDPFGAGQLQLWVNGEKQIDLASIPIGYNNTLAGGYWQYGIYRGQNGTPLTVEYANMRQSRTSLASHIHDADPLSDEP